MGFRTESRLARAAAVTLAVWFGGLSCVLGCAAETAEAAAHMNADHGQGACEDGCCPKSEESGTPQPQHPARELDCCVALVTPTALTSKIPTIQPGPEAATIVSARAPATAQALILESITPDHSCLDRSETYLRLRVLRI